MDSLMTAVRTLASSGSVRTTTITRSGIALIGLLVALVGLLQWHVRVAAFENNPSVSAARMPVLIELFTSEGCSSCPPADALLGKLDRSQPVPNAELIVLSEHVDYWNDIGWKDPYSSHEYSDRQDAYAKRFELESVYTPQMVVDGYTQVVGSDELEAIRDIENAAKAEKIPVALSNVHLDGNNSLVAHVEVGPPVRSTGPKSARLLIALADDSDQTSVTRGENAGRILRHVAVLRSLTQVGTMDLSGPFSKDVQVSTANANSKNLRAVAIVQETASGRVLGVGLTRLSN
jgi:hypothetical protein